MHLSWAGCKSKALAGEQGSWAGPTSPCQGKRGSGVPPGLQPRSTLGAAASSGVQRAGVQGPGRDVVPGSTDFAEEAGAEVTGGGAGRAQHGGDEAAWDAAGRGRAVGRQEGWAVAGALQEGWEARAGVRPLGRPALNTGPRGCSQELCGAADGRLGVQEGGRQVRERELCPCAKTSLAFTAFQ